jgi:peptidoglycan/LPS O-acetylase OafA/YrhL
LYLWHFPLWGVAIALAWPAVVPAFVVVVLLTGAIVHLSWRCVELPFLRRKDGHISAPVPRVVAARMPGGLV